MLLTSTIVPPGAARTKLKIEQPKLSQRRRPSEAGEAMEEGERGCWRTRRRCQGVAGGLVQVSSAREQLYQLDRPSAARGQAIWTDDVGRRTAAAPSRRTRGLATSAICEAVVSNSRRIRLCVGGNGMINGAIAAAWERAECGPRLSCGEPRWMCGSDRGSVVVGRVLVSCT